MCLPVSYSVPVIVKVNAAVPLDATGNTQIPDGATVGINQAAMSHGVSQVTAALLRGLPEYICLPSFPTPTLPTPAIDKHHIGLLYHYSFSEHT